MIATTVIGVGALGGVWWYFGAPGGDTPLNTQSADTPAEVQEVPAPIAERVVSEGVAGENVREYNNKKYRFSLSYPQSLTVTEYDEAGGAMSATFESASDEKSFQIFVTPYGQQEITDERFRLDVPSGVRKELTEIVIDNTRAVMFFSKNALLGETREVWFIKNGYLYEVVTYKDLDAWLAQIMKSWKFL